MSLQKHGRQVNNNRRTSSTTSTSGGGGGGGAVTNRKKSIASNGNDVNGSRKTSVTSSCKASSPIGSEPSQTRVVLSVDRKRSQPHVEKQTGDQSSNSYFNLWFSYTLAHIQYYCLNSNASHKSGFNQIKYRRQILSNRNHLLTLQINYLLMNLNIVLSLNTNSNYWLYV